MSIKMVTFLLPAILLISLHISHVNAVTMDTFHSNLTAFNNGGGYTLSCALSPSDVYSTFQAYSAAFYYYTNDRNDLILLQDFAVNNPTNAIYHTIYDYNSGNYYCRIIMRNLTSGELITFDHTFQIDPNLSPVELGDTCRANQDCMALNAVCVDGECKCEGMNFIKYNHDGDAPACLPGVGSIDGASCAIDEQCQVSDSRYSCQGGICLKTRLARMSPYEIAGVTLGTVAVCLLLVIAGRLATKK